MKLRTLKRSIKYWFQRRTRGWSDDETWNLDYEFIKWVNSRFKKYKEKVSKIVDLEFHRFEYEGKEYTQLELIDKVIKLSNEYIDTNLLSEDKLNSIKDEIFDIFKLIFWTMWW
jgi:hypothetical protein